MRVAQEYLGRLFANATGFARPAASRSEELMHKPREARGGAVARFKGGEVGVVERTGTPAMKTTARRVSAGRCAGTSNVVD